MPAFKYIDSIENKQHIVLFYEDREYARLIEFRFIKNGLMCNERCIYATDEDTGTIVLKMLSYGIPINYFHNGMLQVLPVHKKSGSVDEIFAKSKIDAEKLLSRLVPPFRLVSRLVPDIDNKNGMQAQIKMEEITHKQFEDFGGSLICPYDVSKIEPTRRREWMKQLHENHHVVIHSTRFGENQVNL